MKSLLTILFLIVSVNSFSQIAIPTAQQRTDAKVAEQTRLGIISETQAAWVTVAANYYTKTQLQTSGSSVVHWNNIANFPGNTNQLMRGDGSVGSFPQDSITFYNKNGKINQKVRAFVDTFTVTNSNGGSLDISAAGFTTVISATATTLKNTATVTSVPMASVKTLTTTAITVNFIEGNGTLVNVLGSNVLLGASTILANVQNLLVSVVVYGY